MLTVETRTEFDPAGASGFKPERSLDQGRSGLMHVDVGCTNGRKVAHAPCRSTRSERERGLVTRRPTVAHGRFR
jgi:hypothetical protein